MNNLKEKLMVFLDKYGIVDTKKATGLTYTKLIELMNLNYKTFDDIDFKPIEISKGVVGKIHFDNGYGASIVSSDFSYGGKLGLYELAILDKNGDLTYDTPITNDVIGYLEPEEVTEKLIEIQDLKN